MTGEKIWYRIGLGRFLGGFVLQNEPLSEERKKNQLKKQGDK